MSRRLPPLNALRAFEAAARHRSFTKAAAELNVTQAAISHQVKALENRFGVPLFRRGHQALDLTDAAQHLLPPLTDAFDRIAAATDRLLRRDGGAVLTITTMPSFAAKWLVLRLSRFRDRHPEVEVRLVTTTALADFGREDVDVAIRFGLGRWSGLRAERLMTERIMPVCSPALLEGEHPLVAPDDLRHHVLLHDDYEVDWAAWLRVAGAVGVDPYRGPRFTDSALILQAAMGGQGVALARYSLAADDLAAGRLVRPFPTVIHDRFAYYLVAPPAYFSRPAVAAFRDWIMEEAAGNGPQLSLIHI